MFWNPVPYPAGIVAETSVDGSYLKGDILFLLRRRVKGEGKGIGLENPEAAATFRPFLPLEKQRPLPLPHESTP